MNFKSKGDTIVYHTGADEIIIEMRKLTGLRGIRCVATYTLDTWSVGIKEFIFKNKKTLTNVVKSHLRVFFCGEKLGFEFIFHTRLFLA